MIKLRSRMIKVLLRLLVIVEATPGRRKSADVVANEWIYI